MKANILRHGAKALQKMNPRSSMLRAFTTSTWQLQAQKPTPSTLEADIPANVLLDELDLLIPAPEGVQPRCFDKHPHADSTDSRVADRSSCL